MPGMPAPVTQPSAAAAAGAAAAALLQRQLAQDGSERKDPHGGWTEHQTGDGRKFYFHEETQTSTWEKPEVFMSPEERANDTKWGEYRIWDGRVFYHNHETKVSCWRMPPELRKMREGISGIDDRPLQLTMAEKRRAFLDLMKDRGIDASWSWEAADEAIAEEPQADVLTENVRKQCFSELLSVSMRHRLIEEREKQRNAANALERLIEERFSRPEDAGATYEDAARLLGGAEPWQLLKSDVRRHEVFQNVMERLEEKHKKARAEKRTERVVRLQRFIASDPELKRARLRWKDAVAILAKRDELQEEDPPLEALRVWASLRDLKQAAEHEAEAKAKSKPDPAAFREERKRRDAFVAYLKEMAERGTITALTSWAEVEALSEHEPRLAAMREGRGATAMELFDEFSEDLRLRMPVVAKKLADHKDEDMEKLKVEKKEEQDTSERPPKRQRFDNPEEAPASGAGGAAAAAVPVAAPEEDGDESEEEEGVSALDAIILGGAKVEEAVPGAPAAAAAAAAEAAGDDEADSDDTTSSDDEEDDPLMGLANAAAAAKVAEAARAAAAAAAEAPSRQAPREP